MESAFKQALSQLGNAFNKITSGFSAPAATPMPQPAGNAVNTKWGQVAFKGPSEAPKMQIATPKPTATPFASPVGSPIARMAVNMPKEGVRPTVPAPVVNNLGRNPEVVKKPLYQKAAPAIEAAAKKFNIPASLLYDIGFSEGGFRHDAANETAAGQEVGVPRGLFQFTPYTWDTVATYARKPGSSLTGWLVNGQAPDRNDPVANAMAAAYLIKVGQLGRWEASKGNWGRFYTDDELDPYYAQTQGYVKGQPLFD